MLGAEIDVRLVPISGIRHHCSGVAIDSLLSVPWFVYAFATEAAGASLRGDAYSATGDY